MIALLLALYVSLGVSAQSTSVNDRTPEQEAALQTEKLQKELNLTPEQAKSIYEINLRYAHERRQSNKRADAVNRIGKKNEEINRVLNQKQHQELQSRKRSIQSSGSGNERYNLRTDPKTRVNESQVRRSASPQNTDRPVRTDFRTSTNPTGTTNRATTNSAPVRRNDNPASRSQSGVRSTRESTSSAVEPRTSVPMQGRTSSGTVDRNTSTNPNQRSSSSPARNEERNSNTQQSSGRQSNSRR